MKNAINSLHSRKKIKESYADSEKKNFFTPKVGRTTLCNMWKIDGFQINFLDICKKRPVWSHLLNLVTAAKYFFFTQRRIVFTKHRLIVCFRVEHSVHVESVPYNKSTLVGQMPYLCHDFESCSLVSSRVMSRSKRFEFIIFFN